MPTMSDTMTQRSELLHRTGGAPMAQWRAPATDTLSPGLPMPAAQAETCELMTSAQPRLAATAKRRIAPVEN